MTQLQEKQRIEGAYARLGRLAADNTIKPGTADWVPAWSSDVLEKTVEGILLVPGSRVSDLFQALWSLSANIKLNKTVAAFIRDIVVLVFTRYKSRYEVADFEWMAIQLDEKPSQAQSYLALLALPEPLVMKRRDAILHGLSGTEFLQEATRSLEP